MARGEDNPSPGGESVASSKREASSAASPDGSSVGPAGPSAKKKKIGPGTRGVANLTPDQLAKKRANDREAQRAIRERTKNQIETLEHRIQELTSQQPYQELQAVLRAKEAVEQENAEIKRRLAGIVGMLQPLVAGPGAAESAYVSPAQTHAPPAQNQSVNMSAHSASTPTSTASAGSFDHPASGGEQTKMQLSQQRHELRHGLEMGPERLGLEFLLDPNQRVARIQAGVNGAQDTPQHQHVAMKHDWAGTPHEQGLRVASNPSGGGTNARTAASNSTWSSHPARTEAPTHAPQAQTDGLAGYSAPVKNCGPTCPLDTLLLEFMSERRQRAAEGLPAQEVVGPRYPSVSSLLNPANSVYSHPLSKVFTDILATFPDLSGLPERVAVLYIMFLVMRWQISPTQENYDRLPVWMTPRPSQLFTQHPAWIDHLPFPLMREKMVRTYSHAELPFDNFFIPFTTTLRLNWPYEETDTLLRSPDSEELLINPVFERHLRNLDNWTLGEPFVRAFPSLVGAANFDCKVPPPGVP